MKKKLIAVSCTIALLGLGWCGASWYTGKKIEDNLESSLQSITDILKQAYPEQTFRITYDKFTRGVFSSTFVYKIADVLEEGDNGYAETLHENSVTVYHGPFPTNELARFNLMPQMLTFHVNLEGTYQLSPINQLKVVSKSEYPIQINGSIGYTHHGKIRASIVPIQQNQGIAALNYSGGTMDVDFDTKPFKANNIETNFGNLTVAFMGKPLVDLQNFRIDGVDKGKDSEVIISMKSLSFDNSMLNGFKRNNTETVKGQLNDMSISLSTKELNDNLDTAINLRYHLGKAMINDVDVGTSQFNINVDKIPLKSISELLQPSTMSNGTVAPFIIQAILDEIIKQNPKITLENFSKNKAGESQLNATANISADKSLLIPNIQSLDVNLSISLPMILETLSAVQSEINGLPINGTEKGKSSQETHDALKTLILGQFEEINRNMMKEFEQPLLVIDKDNVKLTIKYDSAASEFELNGKKVPVAKLKSAIESATAPVLSTLNDDEDFDEDNLDDVEEYDEEYDEDYDDEYDDEYDEDESVPAESAPAPMNAQ